MTLSQPHNLNNPIVPEQRPYGLRISLKENDPFRKYLGNEWQKFHWYATADERDARLAEMSREHEYSREGDRPALIFEKVEKLAESRGL